MNLSEEIREGLRAQNIAEKRDLLVKFAKIGATVSKPSYALSNAYSLLDLQFFFRLFPFSTPSKL